MKYPTIRLVFDRKKQATNKTTGLVQLEFTLNRKRKWISTGVKLYAGEWKPQTYVSRRLDADIINENLIGQLEYWQNWINSLRRNNTPFEFDLIDRRLRTATATDNFISYADAKIKQRKDITESTRRTQKKLIQSLLEFGEIKYFSDLTRANILRYDNWLHQKGYLQSTVHSYHKFLKTYINDAIRTGQIEANPYIGITIERGSRNLPRYLTEEEIFKIKNAEIPVEALTKIRDLFVFQCFTGLAFSDLNKFDFTKVVERDGRYVLHDVRQKTGEPFYLVLLSPALEILKKYDFTLPVVTNQQYNLRLKAVGDYARLSKPITSHMARHSFAVYCLNKGVPIEHLARMMGHTDIKTTQIYAKVLNSTVDSAFDMLERGLK